MNDNTVPLAFGDNVRVKETADMLHEGIAGLEAVVHGFTTPSVTGMEPIGALQDDFALNVYVTSLQKDYWLDPSNIELISRPETMEIKVAGKTIRVTQKDGVYKEEIIEERPWWRFW